jgi:hypothetical protein
LTTVGVDLRAVTELQHRRDETDDEGREQLVDVAQVGIRDVTEEEAEVQGGGQQYEEAEDHLLEVHPQPSPAIAVAAAP